MLRYISWIWNKECHRQTDIATMLERRIPSMSSDWHVVLKEEGLRVWTRGERDRSSRTYRLQGQPGIVVGTLSEFVEEQTHCPSLAVEL